MLSHINKSCLSDMTKSISRQKHLHKIDPVKGLVIQTFHDMWHGVIFAYSYTRLKKICTELLIHA